MRDNPIHGDERKRVLGVLSLILATMLWGTSFSFIKLSLYSIDALTYTAYRSLISVLVLLPITLFRILDKKFSYRDLVRGMIIGSTYVSGLYLQGAGTHYVTPSLSAFVTGFSTVNVHLYIAMSTRFYSARDLMSLLLALAGLYIITRPQGGSLVGVLLILASTIPWAAQIILVSRYGGGGLLEMTFGVFLVGVFLTPLSTNSLYQISLETWLYLIYLAIVCSITALLLQIYGQRFVSPKTASVIYLLEPFFAYLFSYMIGLESFDLYILVGGSMITLASYIAIRSER
ncbi:MAG: DMT family transporter [Sulfolobales archaeon]